MSTHDDKLNAPRADAAPMQPPQVTDYDRLVAELADPPPEQQVADADEAGSRAIGRAAAYVVLTLIGLGIGLVLGVIAGLASGLIVIGC